METYVPATDEIWVRLPTPAFMTDKRLTEEEAKQFLELLDKLSKDMRDAFEEAPPFGTGEPPENFEEKWGMSAGIAYTAFMRNKYRQFAENAYLDRKE